MTLALRLTAATLALGLSGTAAQAHCACSVRHHVSHVRYAYAAPVRHVTTVRYVRGPTVVRRYYQPADYRWVDWRPYDYGYGYDDYAYRSYSRPVVIYERPYWRHRYWTSAHWGYGAYDGRWRRGWHDNGRHRGWDHHGWR